MKKYNCFSFLNSETNDRFRSLRNVDCGYANGYVAIPPEHPLYEKSYDDAYWDNNFADKVELDLNGRELIQENGKWFVVKKKPKYPTTFEECLNLLYCKSILKPIIGHKAELLLNLEKLLICRDTYWKIAGEKMGLGKPWEPDWENGRSKFCIINCENCIIKGAYAFANTILAFPTEEIRDTFYENFKELIESCKELL